MIRKPAEPGADDNNWTVRNPAHERGNYLDGQTKPSCKLPMLARARHSTVVRIDIETVKRCTFKHALDFYDSTTVVIATCSL